MTGRDPCQTLEELLATMHTLRAPGGCPWDAAQTPESLAPYLLEEACEVIEAIETGNPAMVADELGDLLLQIVFQAEIFTERGQFDFAEVAAGINAKLWRRHPHVFSAAGPMVNDDELTRQWERIKRAEQPEPAGPRHPLGHLPAHLPALQRAQKLISRSLRHDMLPAALPSLPPASPRLNEAELGQALFSLVQQAEASGLDAEQALRRIVQKFVRETAAPPHEPPNE